MSDTPRADALDNLPICSTFDALTLARQLERELAQVTSERDLLGTVVGTGYPPPANLIKDEMTRRRAARAVELHEEIVWLRERILAAGQEKQLVAWHYYREPYFYVILDQEVAPNDPIRSNGIPLYCLAPRIEQESGAAQP
jgi:hypothetical protein